MFPSTPSILITALLLAIAGLLIAAFLPAKSVKAPCFQDNLRWRINSQGLWLGLIVLFFVIPVSYGLRQQNAHLFTDTLWSFRALEMPILVAPAALLFAAGGLDLSVGAVASLVSAIVVYYSRADANATGVLIAMAIALAIGIAHALAVTLARVPSVILTLGTLLLASTGASYITGGETQMVNAQFPIPASQASVNLLWVPVSLWVLLIAVLGALTPFRRKPGIEQTESLSSRILYLGLPYVMSSVAAGAVGILTLYRFRSNVTFTFTRFELEILAAVLLGGTCFDGRNAAILGGVIASITITATYLLVIYTGVSSDVFTILLGSVAVTAALWTHAHHAILARLYGRRRPTIQ